MAFLNPLFLLGAIAAAGPVLAHLVRQTRAQKVPFPSLMFLRKIEQKTIRRRILRNLFLLALRCLALLLLAFAFSRPYFPAYSAAFTGPQDSASVVLIDTSYSMRYGGVMERAKRAALDIVRNAGLGEKLAVASFGRGFDVLSPMNRDHQPAAVALSQMQAGLESTEYEQAISGADSLLKDAGPGPKRIHLISDFQSAGWDRARSTTKVSRGVTLLPVDVGEAGASNIAVTEVKADSVVYSQKFSGKVTARIANYSLKPADVPVELRLNDLALERRQIPIPAQSSELIEFTGFNVPPGSNRATVSVTGDTFPLDNRFSFTIRREDQRRVLVIETSARGRGESFFLRQALSAGGSDENDLSVVSAGALNPSSAESYQVVIVNDAAGITDALAAALKHFVERGGGLVLAAAKHTDASQFNRLFAGLAPARVGETMQAREYSPLSQIRTDHPLFAPFARSGRLASPRIYAHRACITNDGATTVAALDDGSPIIVEGAHGKGRVVLIATTLDTSWNDLPLTPMYLPLVRRILEYTREGRRPADCVVGQAFRAPADKDGIRPAIEAPGGGRVQDVINEPGGDQIVQAREAGFYGLKYRDHSDSVAANLDTRESDFTRFKPDELVAFFSQQDGQNNAAVSPNAGLTNEQIESKQRVWLPLLLIALALFVAEAVMARRIRVTKLIHD